MSDISVFHNNLTKRLVTVREKELRLNFFSSLLNSIAVALLSFSLAGFVEWIMEGDVAFRTFLFISALAISAVGFAFFALPALLSLLGIRAKQSAENVALRVGTFFPELSDKLSNALQLANESKQFGYSNDLINAAFDEVYTNSKDKNFDLIINKEELKKSALFFFAALGISLISFVTIAGMGEAFNRILNFNKSFIPPAPFSLHLKDADKQILKSEPIDLIIVAEGSLPSEIQLHIKDVGRENYETYPIKLNDKGEFSFSISAARSSFEYYASSTWYADEVKTEIGKIEVRENPIIKSLIGQVSYPSYTKFLPREITERSADISALKGSNVSIKLFSTKNLDSAKVKFEYFNLAETDTNIAREITVVKMKSAGDSASVDFRINKSGIYYFTIYDTQGMTNQSSIKYNITALEDGNPSITLIEPTQNVKMGEQAIVPTQVNISDDYGFSALKLNYRLIKSDFAMPEQKYTQINIPLTGNDLIREVVYIWDLKRLGIMPSESYEFYYEVFDNDIVTGPKSAKTQILTVRLPSFDEAIREADQAQKDVQKELEKVMKTAEELKKEMDELSKDLMKDFKKKEMNWEQKKKAEDIAKKQEQLQEKVKDLQKDLKNTTEQMQQNNMLSPETLQKYMELQQLMQQVSTPEMKKMQQQLQKTMEQMSPQEMQKMLENMKFDEEQFRNSIDRTMKVLKRMQAEQKTDALAKFAKQMEKMQEDIMQEAKEAQKANDGDNKNKENLAKKQESLQKNLETMQDELDKLEQLMKEVGEDMPMADLEQAKKDLDAEKTQEMMEQAKQDMEKGEMQKASNKQKEASKNLKDFSQKMQEMKKKMNDQVSKEEMRQMQKSISDMLDISKKQQELKEKTANSNYNSNKLPEINKEQGQNQEALQSVVNRLTELAEKSLAVTPDMGREIGNAMREMSIATAELAERQTSKAQKAQLEAMTALNKAAAMMQEMMAQMQGGGMCDSGGSGMGGKPQPGMGNSSAQSFMQKMQQAAAQQQMINQSLQQMMGGQQSQQGNTPNSNDGGQEQMRRQAEYGRLAGEQGSAKKSLEELMKEQQELAGDKKTKDELTKIAKEMEEIMSDIESGNVNENLMKKQDKILSRLLEISRSANERDFEKKREGRTAKDIFRRNPEELDLGTEEGRRRASSELMKSLEMGYTKDYEALIRRYFEALKSER